jgi:hypothetical protein
MLSNQVFSKPGRSNKGDGDVIFNVAYHFVHDSACSRPLCASPPQADERPQQTTKWLRKARQAARQFHRWNNTIKMHR